MILATMGLETQSIEAGRCVMKALVLAFHREERMYDEEGPLNSCMRIYEGRHLIQYSLDAAIESKAEEILIAVGCEAEEIINAFGIIYRDIRVKYVLLKEEHGFLDAMRLAREPLEYDDFIMFQGDEIVCNPHPYEMIENFYEQDLFIECGVVQVPVTQVIGHTYGVIYDPYDYRVYRIVDKPRRPVNSFMGTSICVFRNEIVEFLDRICTDERKEKNELPDLMQCVIDDGYAVKLFVVGSGCIEKDMMDDPGNCEQERVEEHEWKLELEPVF